MDSPQWGVTVGVLAGPFEPELKAHTPLPFGNLPDEHLLVVAAESVGQALTEYVEQRARALDAATPRRYRSLIAHIPLFRRSSAR